MKPERLALAVTRHGKGRSLVWVHGFPHSAALFEKQRAIKGVQHLFVDLPGFGLSPMQDIDSIDDFGESVLRSLDELEIEEALFAGVSMGGYVVMSILHQAPARVSGLILISTREAADSEAARRSRGDSIENVRMNGPSSLIESMLPKMLTSEGLMNPSLSATVRSIMESASSEGITAALRAMADRPDRSALLSSVSRPTLLVFGEQDTIITAEDQQRMRSLLPDATLCIVPHAAHLPNLEQPEVLNAAVERFLELNVADSLQGQTR